MEWWGWVLIAAGVLVLGYVKLKVFSKIVKKRKVSSFKDED
jgi:hypothetical protein